MRISNQRYMLLAWLSLAVVILIPLLFWLDTYNWSLKAVSAVTIFPLLGIWAWSIMWTHYFLGGVRLLTGGEKYALYTKITGYSVLALIVLHPALLAWQQWTTNQLLPPMSFYDFVASSMKMYVFFGSVSLLLFITYAIVRRFKNKPIIQNNWHWISISQAVAMILIFIHALAIGGLTNNASYELYWVLLGALLLPCAGLVVRNDWLESHKP